MVEITLFEVHVEDASFDANAEAIANAPLGGLASLLGRGGDGDDADESAAEEHDTEAATEASAADDSGLPGPSVGKLLVLVVALAVAAVVARRVVAGGGDETVVTEDEESEIAEIDVGE